MTGAPIKPYQCGLTEFFESRLAFDAIIDVRTSEEFADDHIPGAINLPVLDEAERHTIGYTYKQESPFPAKRLGAAKILRHIADMLERDFADKPREWKPLVYCWRGGKRSGTLTHLLNEVGWKARQITGGYKAFRTHVIESLEQTPTAQFRVVAGPTGSGKTRLLNALDRAGAQVLDLEALANHRGSLLGDVGPQPSQKWFESQVWDALATFDPSQSVYVESESKKIGNVAVPEALMTAMRASRCVRVQAADAVRLRLLEEEYRDLLLDTPRLEARVKHLIPLRGHDRINQWLDWSRAGDFDALTLSLLHDHYDPAYFQSIHKNFSTYATSPTVTIASPALHAFDQAAQQLIAQPHHA
jgi:tRNA 2-selenouridine synthase